jgi:carbon monoxide dehydrogenase subunit G
MAPGATRRRFSDMPASRPSRADGFPRDRQTKEKTMAHIHREILIEAPPGQVWAALSDVGALHTRLVPGFVTDCVYDGEARTVTFGNGQVVRERIIDVDDGKKRVAWTSEGGTLTHYSASAQLFAAGPDTCRVVWLADLLPHEAAPAIASMIEQGLAAMKRHLEAMQKATL